MKTIAYYGGMWAPNIGNAFFNLGITYALNKCLPDVHTSFIGDPPGWFWRSRRNTTDQNIMIDELQVDYIAISGPMICEEFEAVWGGSLLRLTKNGTRIILISAGCMKYDDAEYEKCAPFLEKIKPYLLMTRDWDTYKRYSDFAEHSYDGICFAFFSADHLVAPLNVCSKDIALCFDLGKDYNVIEEYGPDLMRLIDTDEWDIHRQHKPVKRSSRASKISSYEGYRIVRPYHSSNPLMEKKIKSIMLGYRPFQKPNCYISDIPNGYLNIYKNAKITVAERVHACVPAVAFGNYAWLMHGTKRARLFSRLGLDDITRRPVRINMEKLAAEKDKILACLSEVIT